MEADHKRRSKAVRDWPKPSAIAQLGVKDEVSAMEGNREWKFTALPDHAMLDRFGKNEAKASSLPGNSSDD